MGKKKDWGWLWVEAMAQPKLEEAVDVGGFGYPAMVVLSHKKMKYSTLTGSFSYDGLNEFLRDLSYGKGRTTPVRGASLPKLPTIDAWDGKSGGGGGGSSSNANAGTGEGKDVVELTDGNFRKEVLMEKETGWLVEFYAPWCGHCKNLAPAWADAATKLKGKMNLGALDATQHGSTAQEYGVQGYPTIKYFAPGSSEPEEYDGGRTADAIVKWAEEKFAENIPPPEVVEAVSNEVVAEACEKHPLCVMSFLPHILDCDAACRNGHIDNLKKLGEKYKKKDWGWLWVEAMAQPKLEEAVDVGGFGYPAMVVLSHKK